MTFSSFCDQEQLIQFQMSGPNLKHLAYASSLPGWLDEIFQKMTK